MLKQEKSTNLLRRAEEGLRAAGITNAYMEARWLLASALRIRPSILYASPGLEVSSEDLEQYWHYIRERLTGRPLAYIVGEQPFFELDFYVNEDVLIPRPETEELVEHSLKELVQNLLPALNGDKTHRLRILDLCAGSGCIGLSLLHRLPEAMLVLADISPAALRIAERNALRHFRHHRIVSLVANSRVSVAKANTGSADILLVQSDLYEGISAHKEALGQEGFDLIVSNPPYIHPDEQHDLDASVRDFEPHEALFCEDPVKLYREILCGARDRLRPGGSILVELAPRWADPIRDLGRRLFGQSGLILDASKKERFFYGRKKEQEDCP